MSCGKYETAVRQLYGGNASRKVGRGDEDFIKETEMSSDVMKNYEASMNSFAKEKLLDDLLAVLNGLGISIPDTKSRTELVDKLLDTIPNRRRNGKNFSSEAEKQKKLCTTIAAAFNKQFGRKIFDESLPAPVLCQQIAELVGSLGTGIHTEFLTVYGDLKKRLRNIELLRQSLNEVNDQLTKQVQSSSDVLLVSKVATLRDATVLILTSLDQQIESLKNMLNVDLSPVETNLLKFITTKEPKEWSLDGELGTSEFSDTLSKILQGVVTSAYTSEMVQSALKKVGLTTGEYLEINTLNDLVKKLSELSQNVNTKSEKEMTEFFKNAEILTKNFSTKYNINKKLKESENMSVEGSAEPSVFDDPYATSLDRRIELKKNLTDLAMYSFNVEFSSAWDKIIVSLDMLSKKIGTETPSSDALEGLRESLLRLSNDPIMYQNKVDKSLTGYWQDAMSRNRKDKFISELKMVRAHLDALLAMSAYSTVHNLLTDVKESINHLLSIIDMHSDKVKKQLGAGELIQGANDTCDENSTQGGNEAYTGGFDNVKVLNVNMPVPLTRTPQRISNALRNFDYNIRVGQMRRNVANFSGEISHYAEKYEKLRALAVAGRLNERAAELKDLLESPNNVALNGAQVQSVKTMRDALTAAPADAKKALDLGEQNLKECANAYKKFLQTVESVDHLLTHFTDNLVKNLDEVDNITKMIESSPINTDWYSDKDGNTLAYVFDALNAGKRDADTIKRTPGDHYYNQLQASGVVANLNNNTGLNPEEFAEVHKQHKSFIKAVQILKNIMSVFVSIGSKINNVDVNQKTYMTPTQIYNNLCEYLVWCMFTYRRPVVAVGAAGAVAEGNVADLAGVNARFKVQARNSVPEFDDKLFMLTIKAMCAKIFTVLGLQDVMKRPLEHAKFSPIRVMLGGADLVPKVHTEALELYLRLPLLAYYYRDMFDFYNDDGTVDGKLPTFRRVSNLAGKPNDNLLKITMVPEMEGVFSGLIELVFNKYRSLTYDQLSESSMIDLVHEVNAIYEKEKSHVKSGETVASCAIYDFVNEVNRRFGIVLKDQRDLYVKEKIPRHDYTDPAGDERDTNLPLLPGETEIELERPTPSSSYLDKQLTLSSSTAGKNPYKLQENQQRLVYLFRCHLDKLMEKLGDAQVVSFKPLIEATKHKLDANSDDKARFDIVSRMLRDSSVQSQYDDNKLMMFHETVVSGLNVLSALHTYLKQFKAFVHFGDLDYILNNVEHLITTGNRNALLTELLRRLNVDKNIQLNDADLTVLKPMLERMFNVGPYVVPAAGAVLTNRDRVARLRVIINFDEFMKVYSENLFLFENVQNLVDIKFVDGEKKTRVLMDWSGMKTMVEQLFSSVGYFLELLRPNIPESLYVKFTDKKSLGSYYWLQEQLIEKLINGRENVPADGGTPQQSRNYINLDKLSETVNKTWNYLTANYAVSATGGAVPAELINYENTFKQLVYGDVYVDNIGVNGVSSVREAGISKLLTQAALEPDHKLILTDVNRSSHAIYSFDGTFNKAYKNLWTGFNELLAKFVWRFYDDSAKKIYKNVIDSLVNGSLNKQVFEDGASWVDTYPSGVAGPLTVEQIDNITVAGIGAGGLNTVFLATKPSQNKFLLRSLARILRTLYSVRRKNDTKPYYLLDSVAEVSNYMKENYRANMPTFRNLFKELIVRTEFYRRIMACNCIRIGTADVQQELDDLCGSIVDASTDIVKACDLVLREVGDEPKFFELYQNSTADYKMQNNKLPFMPTSDLLRVLNNAVNLDEFLPTRSLGEPEFKYQYGTRGLLNGNKPISLNDLPSLSELLDNYAITTSGAFGVDKKKVEDLMNNIVKSLRAVNTMRNYKGFNSSSLSAANLNTALPNFIDLVINGAAANPLVAPAGAARGVNQYYLRSINLDNTQNKLQSNASVALYLTLSRTIKLTESPFKEQQIKDFMKEFSHSILSTMPAIERNILDLQIPPINIHALMRDIPLVNIYNYAYTFDRMVVNTVLGLNTDASDEVISELCAYNNLHNDSGNYGNGGYNNSNLTRPGAPGVIPDIESRYPYANFDVKNMSGREIIALMCVNPYINLDDDSINMVLRYLATGYDNTELGRPKFLSDQLYNKVLLRTLYSGQNQYSQVGPLADNNLRFEGIQLEKVPDNRLTYIVKQPGAAAPIATRRRGTNNNTSLSQDQIKEVNFAGLAGNEFNTIGVRRFNTLLCRNILFLCNIQRLIRYKLYLDAYYQDNSMVIQKGAHITNPAHTEFRGNEVWTPKKVERPRDPDPVQPDCETLGRL